MTRDGPTTEPTPGAQACWSVLGLRSCSRGVGRRGRPRPTAVSSRSAPDRAWCVRGPGGAGLAWAWSHASGGDARLYRGGLLMVALAVAVLLAHVVLVPRGWSARVLSVAPLVLVGRISYGIYLWHWPTFIALNSDRTGRQGAELFVLRCLVTLGIAALSYVLVERPIRDGGLPSSPRAAPITSPASPRSLLGTVAALVVVTTAVAAPRPADAP